MSTPNESNSQPNSTPLGSSQPSEAANNSSFPSPGENSQAPTSNNPINLDEDEDEVVSHGRNKRLKSVVWQHFERVTIEGVDKAICNHCSKKLGGSTRNGTKHLHEHLKRCPRRKLVDMRQKVITTNFLKGDGKRKLEPYTFDQETARGELANMIILHEYPLSIVDHVGFRRFATALQPVFRMVSRNTVKSDILKIYDYERIKTMKLIEGNSSRIAITTDMWTASNQKKGFMAITGHFIDDSWTLQSRILRFVYVPCPHTKEVLCDVLVNCFLDWNVDRKISTVTVDNCSTNDAMMQLLVDKLESSQLILGGSLLHMRCCAHILNLIVKDGLDVIREGIEKIRDSVHFWTTTPKREEKFEEAARQLRIPCTKKLGLDCPTRWNSTYLMLQTAIVYKDAFSRLKQRESQYKTCPSDEDWEFANEVCSRLKIFYNVTESFSGTKFPTANLYFPKVCQIRIFMQQWLVSSNEVIRKMAVNMVEKYDKYWAVIHGILGVAAVLDPRYKISALEYYFPIIYGEEESICEIEKVRKYCDGLFSEYKRQTRIEKASMESSQPSSTSVSTFDFDLEGCDSDYDRFISNKKKDKVETKTELDYYLEEEVLPRDPNFDILGWWNSNGLKYPTLKKIAKDILAIPVSTVASESAFSTSGRLVSPHRSRLHPKTLEALMCAQSWLWAKEMQTKDCSSVESNGYATIYNDMDIDEACVTEEISLVD